MIRLIWRGVVFVYREVFTGLMLGLIALFLLMKISPNRQSDVGLLIALGLLAGLAKGLAKFIFVEMINRIPADEYSTNFPKYKMLALWLTLFVVSAGLNYGLNIFKWFAEPAKLISESVVLGNPPQLIVGFILLFVVLSGVASYFYEPD